IRLSGPTPRIVPEVPVWQHRLAAAMHLALYLFLIVMPLLGWLALSADGKPVPFFGLELPALWG
ncbi:MAG: cytochrome B, partial [Xanthomonadales bacterium]|nr:cytochrome B [Xanthomonadales bacterium]